MPNNQLNEVYTYLLGKRRVKGKGDFADKLGYHRTYVSDLLHGKKPVTHQVAQVLFDKFSINSEWMLNNEGEMLTYNDVSPVYTTNSASEAKHKAKTLRDAIKIMSDVAERLEMEAKTQQKIKAKKK